MNSPLGDCLSNLSVVDKDCGYLGFSYVRPGAAFLSGIFGNVPLMVNDVLNIFSGTQCWLKFQKYFHCRSCSLRHSWSLTDDTPLLGAVFSPCRQYLGREGQPRHRRRSWWWLVTCQVAPQDTCTSGGTICQASLATQYGDYLHCMCGLMVSRADGRVLSMVFKMN